MVLGITAGSQYSRMMKLSQSLKILKLAVDCNIQFSTLFSQGTALFQEVQCISNAFSRKILLEGCLLSVNFAKPYDFGLIPTTIVMNHTRQINQCICQIYSVHAS